RLDTPRDAKPGIEVRPRGDVPSSWIESAFFAFILPCAEVWDRNKPGGFPRRIIFGVLLAHPPLHLLHERAFFSSGLFTTAKLVLDFRDAFAVSGILLRRECRAEQGNGQQKGTKENHG